MALAGHGNQPFGLELAFVYPFSGGLPGTGKEFPGIVSIEGEPDQDTVEHRGGNRTLSKVNTLNGFDLTLTLGLHDVDAIAAVVGGTVSTTGTTPSQVRKIVHKTTDTPADFGLKGDTPSRSSDGGRTRLIVPRCQSGGLPSYGFVLDEYRDLELTASGIPNAANEIIIYEQAETNTMVITATF